MRIFATAVGALDEPPSCFRVSWSIEQKVAVITGAPQGVGAALVKAYRDRDYCMATTACCIRVNEVAPGVIKSPMHPVETYTQLAVLHPLGGMGEIFEIVDAILCLESGSFVTGEILHVDGGRTAGH